MLGALGQDQTGKNNADYILVLLVDDEDSQIELMKLNLQYADPSLTITSTSTPSSALKLVSDHAFDCIVSDYQMREMNGIQLCTEIKKMRKVPFIIYTARGSEEVAEEAFSVGVDDYVRKESELSHYKVLARRIRHVVEKNRAEVALQGSRDQLNSMLERVTDNFVSFDPEWRYVYANDSALRNLRKTRDEIIGRVLWDVFPGLSDTIYGEKYREAMEKQVPLEFEAYYQPYDMWTYMKAFPSTQGLTLFYQDVSAHKRAEEEAKKTRQTNDLLANLLEKSSQPFGVGYPDGRLGLVNEAFEKLTGYTRDELSTIDWVKVLTPRSGSS